MTHLREYLESVASLKGGKGVEAWLLEHGEPMENRLPADPSLPSERKQCFSNCTNAVLLMAAPKGFKYTEGYAVRLDLGVPIHHAWLSNASGDVIDPTWDEGAAHYFGVPFKSKYLRETVLRTHYYGMLFPDGFMFNRHLLKDKPAQFRALSQLAPDAQKD